MEKKQKKLNNGGFSLIELIVVIAIMAILVGVMAPNVIKYVERSRESADKQLLDNVRTAAMTANIDPSVSNAPGNTNGAKSVSGAPFTADSSSFSTMFWSNVGVANASGLTAALKSTKFKSCDVRVAIDANNNAVAYFYASADASAAILYDTATATEN